MGGVRDDAIRRCRADPRMNGTATAPRGTDRPSPSESSELDDLNARREADAAIRSCVSVIEQMSPFWLAGFDVVLGGTPVLAEVVAEINRVWNLAGSRDDVTITWWAGLHADACASYRRGEIDSRRLLRFTCVCTREVSPSHRAELIASTATMVAVTPQAALNRSRPPVPLFVRRCAVDVLGMIERALPDRPLKPRPENHVGSPVLAATLFLLEHWGLIPPDGIAPKTLYNWYRADRHDRQRRRGRPRGR
jgi:hypothetical protein